MSEEAATSYNHVFKDLFKGFYSDEIDFARQMVDAITERKNELSEIEGNDVGVYATLDDLTTWRSLDSDLRHLCAVGYLTGQFRRSGECRRGDNGFPLAYEIQRWAKKKKKGPNITKAIFDEYCEENKIPKRYVNILSTALVSFIPYCSQTITPRSH